MNMILMIAKIKNQINLINHAKIIVQLNSCIFVPN